MLRKVILCPNPYRDAQLRVAKEAKRVLDEVGCPNVVCLPFRNQEPPEGYGLNIEPLQQEIRGADMIIAFGGDGTILHLKDVADIELGSESYAYKGYTNGHPGVSTMIFQTAGSNATQVVNDVNALLDELQAELPKGIAIAHLQSVNDFLYASMKEVVRRRYSRAIEEGSPLPDLIITDGGKGQMEVVREVIEDELHLDIPIAGLAKDRKHRTSAF